MRLLPVPVLLLVLPLLAAGGSDPTGPGTHTPASTSGASSSQTRRDMQRHDELAEKARAAVVAGDLEAFRLGMEIAAVQPLPGSQGAHASTFVERAKAGTTVTELPKAATTLGSLGAACATCHLARPRKRYPASGFESGDSDVLDRMQQHWWAVDALWQGLVEPSDPAWEAGAKALTGQDLTELRGFPKASPVARTQAGELRLAAKAALSTPVQVDARGRAFARVIATCAACHQGTQAGPKVTD